MGACGGAVIRVGERCGHWPTVKRAAWWSSVDEVPTRTVQQPGETVSLLLPWFQYATPPAGLPGAQRRGPRGERAVFCSGYHSDSVAGVVVIDNRRRQPPHPRRGSTQRATRYAAMPSTPAGALLDKLCRQWSISRGASRLRGLSIVCQGGAAVIRDPEMI